NGQVSRFALTGREGRYFRYEATVRPWLWYATRRTDCRIFQQMTVPQILDAVLGFYGFPIKKRLTGRYRVWEYCVQYRESDFNFISRLMEQEGIYTTTSSMPRARIRWCCAIRPRRTTRSPVMRAFPTTRPS